MRNSYLQYTVFGILISIIGCSKSTNNEGVSKLKFDQSSYNDLNQFPETNSGETTLTEQVTRLAYSYYDSLTDYDKPSYADRNGNCGDVSIMWSKALEEEELNFFYEQTQTVGRLSVEGSSVDFLRAESYLSKAHYFLTVEKNGEKLIFDPTYLQFFETIPSDLTNKLIFIGSSEELRDLYRRNKSYLRLDVAGDTNHGRYDPDQLFEFIYSTGEYESGRISIPITP
jgi:hypothetical protein